ncbi:MAG: MBL fold metallo-hydrolase [Planctomycetota bacterium]|nr:MAG: MBL fold metallo-hydrolase [Planctomycetota bacterium]
MLERRPLFPNVIELNHQAGHRIGCCVYLIYDGPQWLLVDIGYEDTVDEVVDLIRDMDFSLANCQTIIATHADVDHIQGLAKAKQALRTTVTAHPKAVKALETGDRLLTFAEISAQDISLDMPPVKVDRQVNDGDTIQVGNLALEVWHTPGHTDSQLAFRLGKLLLSGDNLFRDGCVGAIDAHHGSDLADFLKSLERIKASDVEWLLPSHGPPFRKDNALVQKTVDRMKTYLHMADFGTCAIDWPLMDEWDRDLAEGRMPE